MAAGLGVVEDHLLLNSSICSAAEVVEEAEEQQEHREEEQEEEPEEGQGRSLPPALPAPGGGPGGEGRRSDLCSPADTLLRRCSNTLRFCWVLLSALLDSLTAWLKGLCQEHIDISTVLRLERSMLMQQVKQVGGRRRSKSSHLQMPSRLLLLLSPGEGSHQGGYPPPLPGADAEELQGGWAGLLSP